jgi:1A family penicillin-binding protein
LPEIEKNATMNISMAGRKYYRKIYQTNKKTNPLFFVLKLLGLGLFLLVFGSLIIFVYYAKDLPRPEKFTERSLIQSTKIYDRSGEHLLYEIYGEEKRTWVSLDGIPDDMQKGVIATEDATFYSNPGIDLKGIARAILADLKIKKFTYGGSTIPQQLIRSTFLTLDKTPQRKIREIILTLELSRRYSKDQILEWYLNQVPFGRNAYGVEAAAQSYFGKPVTDISLSEAATLAALIQSPSYYSAEEHLQELTDRKNYVLDRMTAEGYINKDDAANAKNEAVDFVKSTQPIQAPHFVMYVKDYLIQKYGEEFLQQNGLKVYTSLDWDLQQAAEKIVKQGAKANEAYHAYNASLVSIDPKTGEILAMVGSKDWFADPYPKGCVPGSDCLFEPYPNVALRGRQPGSSFKPFVYATAFKKGYDDKYVVIDEETNFGIWGGQSYIPQNYDGKFRGPVTLRQALSQSLNVPSVKVLAYLAGLDDSIQTAKDFGITTLDNPSSFYGLAIVLGGGEVKLLDMVSAYGVFATEGLMVPPVAILKIENSQGSIIEENKKNPHRVLDKEPARLINDILSDNEARAPMFGPNSLMHFQDYQVAAKTGTTQDYRDGWIIGYTPTIVTGVWTGNNDNSPMSREPGIVIAGPIWRAFMDQAMPKFPKENFTKPLPSPATSTLPDMGQ